MRTRTKWAWLNMWGYVISIHPKRRLAIEACVTHGFLPAGYDKIEMTPRARWRVMQKHGYRVVRLRGCL